MKKLIFIAVMLSPLLSLAQEPLTDEQKSAICVRHLLEGHYAPDYRATELCEQFPHNTISCAMDIIDMKIKSDLFEAIEYCANPLGQP